MYRLGRFSLFALSYLLIVVTSAGAELPNPVLKSVFPPGGQTGSAIEVTVAGTGLDEVSRLICSLPEISTEKIAQNRFRITIPKSVPVGACDLRVFCRNGLSSPRTFFIGNRSDLLEVEPNETVSSAQTASLDITLNGRIEKKGDVDCFQFSARQGQRVIIECWAERIDSSLRAIVEVYDAGGRRLAVNRGYFCIDPLINFPVPADGTYIVTVFDLVYSGRPDHFYRLDIDSGPRMLFSVPSAIPRGTTSQVSIYGWNLGKLQNQSIPEIAGSNASEVERQQLELGIVKQQEQSQKNRRRSLTANGLETLAVTVTPPAENQAPFFPIRTRSEQAGIDGFTFHLEGCHAPLRIGLSDVPVLREQKSHQSPDTAQEIRCPSEVSGQLIAGNEQDWYAIQARRGEVLWFEALGQRIGSPVDLDISLFDASAGKTLKQFSDEVKNIAGKKFPTSHLDPAGKWIVPEDGRYLIMIRNLRGGLKDDPRRVYRFSIGRQEPEFQL
ncbi:MAG: PPC domain-containing protein, partial [Planctomycetaceae bacterium]|nr:PPC domain-containing protein [Planctomycetaceae bacterium]